VAVIFAVPVRVSAATAAREALPEELKILSKKGLDCIYGVDIPAAEKYFKTALEKYPEHPFPYFGIAMVTWANLEYLEDESDPALEASYSSLTDKAIEVGKVWVKKHPGDANAYLCMGGLYGLRARLAVLQHRWIRAYLDGRKALKNMRKSVDIDPELYDAYLGLGMYEYYAGTLPGVVKFLAKLVMPGNAREGIRLLNICREKGYFNSLGAKLLLIEIYTQTGSPYADPPTAVKWSKELRAMFPNHAQMHFVEIVSLFENRQYDESLRESMDYLRRVYDKENTVYRARFLPRVLTAIGTDYLVEGKYDLAAEYFLKARNTINENKNAHPARWAVWAIVRLGNVSDLRGKRAEALEYYREAKSFGDEWGFHESADKYIKKPFAKSELPGSLPPP